MKHSQRLVFEERLKAIGERLTALEATPRVRDAMTAAGLALPALSQKPNFLKSAASMWPTAIRKPVRLK